MPELGQESNLLYPPSCSRFWVAWQVLAPLWASFSHLNSAEFSEALSIWNTAVCILPSAVLLSLHQQVRMEPMVAWHSIWHLSLASSVAFQALNQNTSQGSQGIFSVPAPSPPSSSSSPRLFCAEGIPILQRQDTEARGGVVMRRPEDMQMLDG